MNNNLVEWFKKGSDVRVADTVMNNALGGTSLGYIVAISDKDDYIKTPEAMRYIEGLQRRLEKAVRRRQDDLCRGLREEDKPRAS